MPTFQKIRNSCELILYVGHHLVLIYPYGAEYSIILDRRVGPESLIAALGVCLRFLLKVFFFSANILRAKRFLQIRTSALFGAKNLRFFDIYSVSAWTRGKGA